ncbi:MAG: cupredoxin domain-containing protein [Thermomicrobium sp.]|nr:cupredoxin domain-containing protein [Thermomicrobium sp.]
MSERYTERVTRRALLRRTVGLVIAVPAASALLAACGGGGGGGGTTSGGGGGKITIEMSEYKYNPSTISVSAGQSVTVTLKNVGTLQHDFHCDQINPTTSALVDPGKSLDFTFTAPSQAGTYDFWCTVAGHKELGMVGKLEVK